MFSLIASARFCCSSRPCCCRRIQTGVGSQWSHISCFFHLHAWQTSKDCILVSQSLHTCLICLHRWHTMSFCFFERLSASSFVMMIRFCLDPALCTSSSSTAIGFLLDLGISSTAVQVCWCWMMGVVPMLFPVERVLWSVDWYYCRLKGLEGEMENAYRGDV